MSSPAIAVDSVPAARGARVRVHSRKRRAPTGVLPLIDVAIAPALELRPAGRRRPPLYVLGLAIAALALHGGLYWYVTHFKFDDVIAPVKHEVAVELVRPPKPIPPPKVEPPQPQPQRKQPAKVLPPIQTATPEPSNIAEPVAAEPVAVAPVVTAQPEPVVEAVTEPVGRAGYLNNPPPDYPPMAARQGWGGTVVLRVRVLSTGRVETVEIQKSSGRRVLDEEAMSTVKNWLFTPSKRGSTPIDGWATVPIEFSLDG